MNEVDRILREAGAGPNVMRVAQPSRVVEIEECLFDLNDIVAIENEGSCTVLHLRGSPSTILLETTYEKFKDLIGANPQKLEVTDEG